LALSYRKFGLRHEEELSSARLEKLTHVLKFDSEIVGVNVLTLERTESMANGCKDNRLQVKRNKCAKDVDVADERIEIVPDPNPKCEEVNMY